MRVNQLKIGALLSYTGLFLGTVISLLYTPYMLRVLGKSEYGIFSLVNSTVAYLSVLDFGFGNAIIRYTAKFRAEGNRKKEQSMHGMFLILYIAIGVLVSLLGIILLNHVRQIFGGSLSNSELSTAKVLLMLAVLNIALSFPFSIFTSVIKAYERFVFAQVVQLIRFIGNPLIIVIILEMGYKSIGIIIATTIVSLFLNIINMGYCLKKLKIKVKFANFELSLLKEILVYSFFIFLDIIVDRIYWSTGQFLLGIFSGAIAVSVFSVGIQISQYYMSLSLAISGMFLPRITAINTLNGDPRCLTELFIKVGRLQFIILSLALCGFIILGKPFITQWAGSDYSDAYYISLILLIPLTVPLIQNLGIAILQAKNMLVFRSITYLLISVCNVSITIPLIKFFGIFGGAMGTSAALCLGNIIIMNFYYHIKIKINIPIFWIEIIKIFPSVLIPSFVVKGLIYINPITSTVDLILYVILISVLFSISVWFFGAECF